jgi:hypothetical protein
LEGLETKHAHVELFGLVRSFSVKKEKIFVVVVVAVERVGNPRGLSKRPVGNT